MKYKLKTVSIIIPLYNREELVKETLDSVLAQTYPHWECIIVDDGSTDRSLEVAQNYAARDNRFKVFQRRRDPKGAPTCRNIGLDEAEGDFIAFLDSDDLFLPNHLELNIQKVEAENADFLYGSSIVFDLSGKKSTKITRDMRENEKPLDFLLGDGHATTPTFFMKKQVCKYIKWNENLKRHQDYDYFMRVHKHFKMQAVIKPTVIINWQEIRVVDFDSCINFMNLHSDEISPEIYLKYNKFMHDYSLLKPETEKYVYFYKRKAQHLIKHLSFLDYLSYYRSKSLIRVQLIKFHFVLLNLFGRTKSTKTKNYSNAIKDHLQKDHGLNRFDNRFSIISSNCWGSTIYEDWNLPYTTPTVGLFFFAPCFIRLLKDIKKYMDITPVFINESRYPEANEYRNQKYAYPIGLLGGEIEIHFLHYKAEEEALEKWEKRKKRIDYNHLWVSCTDRDAMTPELMKKFDNLPFEKKVLFTAQKQPEIKCAVQLKAYRTMKEVGDLYNQRYNVTKDFDVAEWLNQ